jgi:23S rRNA-intervening sequence protein
MKRIPARSFRDLIVWQKAHQFVLAVYRCTRRFPKEEI